MQPVEALVVDTGHVVASDLCLRFQLRPAVQGKTMQSLKSGEGNVFDFTRPGRLYLQTRNPDAFQGWVRANAPQESANGGVLGGLFS